MECPQCKLENPPGAFVCDCGYRFQSRLLVKNGAVVEEHPNGNYIHEYSHFSLAFSSVLSYYWFMKPIQKLFEWTYRNTAGRRAHSHRCRCCWKVVHPDQAVLVLRLDAHKTWMLHIECASMPHTEKTTWRNAFEMWAGLREVA